ncbi:MAG: hypothetical protein Tsb005_07780 [Gammaproteobacteria bacterium]
MLQFECINASTQSLPYQLLTLMKNWKDDAGEILQEHQEQMLDALLAQDQNQDLLHTLHYRLLHGTLELNARDVAEFLKKSTLVAHLNKVFATYFYQDQANCFVIQGDLAQLKQHLLQHKNDINFQMLFETAITNNKIDIVDYLIDNYAEKLKHIAPKQLTQLLWLLIVNPSFDTQATAQKFINTLPLDVNSQEAHKSSKAGWTLLHLACLNGQVMIARALLAKGAKVDLVTDSGLMPVHTAVQVLQPAIGYLDAKIINNIKKASTELLQVLEQYGADLTAVTVQGLNTPLHIAISNKLDDVIEYFAQHYPQSFILKNAENKSALNLLAGYSVSFMNKISDIISSTTATTVSSFKTPKPTTSVPSNQFTFYSPPQKLNEITFNTTVNNTNHEITLQYNGVLSMSNEKFTITGASCICISEGDTQLKFENTDKQRTLNLAEGKVTGISIHANSSYLLLGGSHLQDFSGSRTIWLNDISRLPQSIRKPFASEATSPTTHYTYSL